MARALYLVAYDVRDPRRLARVHRLVRAHGLGGQKSVHECRFGETQRRELADALAAAIDPTVDRLMFVRLEPRARPILLGAAAPPADPAFLYVG